MARCTESDPFACACRAGVASAVFACAFTRTAGSGSGTAAFEALGWASQAVARATHTVSAAAAAEARCPTVSLTCWAFRPYGQRCCRSERVGRLVCDSAVDAAAVFAGYPSLSLAPWAHLYAEPLAIDAWCRRSRAQQGLLAGREGCRLFARRPRVTHCHPPRCLLTHLIVACPLRQQQPQLIGVSLCPNSPRPAACRAGQPLAAQELRPITAVAQRLHNERSSPRTRTDLTGFDRS